MDGRFTLGKKMSRVLALVGLVRSNLDVASPDLFFYESQLLMLIESRADSFEFGILMENLHICVNGILSRRELGNAKMQLDTLIRQLEAFDK